MVKEGRVLRSYSGYYYVACGDTVYTCKVRGHMKKERFSLCTGDLVRFDADDVPSEEGAKGMITEVLPRRNHLTRPTVANMDLNVITTSLADPDLSFLILDKLLVLAARGNMPCLIVLTKADLVSPEAAEQVAAVYRDIGYEVFIVSSRTGQGIDALRERLQGLITVVGGPSGVGKSSLLNALEPGTVRQTGAVSRKIGRGRHTTRFTDLVPFNGGYLADSPGFGNVFLDAMEPAELPHYFREFAAYEDQCRFRPCSHTHEPVCGVKDAVAAGKIARSRYASYQTMWEELKAEQEKRYL
ncbi:MAG TPA: ribosome small subunit-dependent GTPase A [Acidaminococcaceae bacterium]|nr:ribosome small subunit-dependent GTPase A [Acidaminococcaceae bacterium]